eukprot:UN11075
MNMAHSDSSQNIPLLAAWKSYRPCLQTFIVQIHWIFTYIFIHHMSNGIGWDTYNNSCW